MTNIVNRAIKAMHDAMAPHDERHQRMFYFTRNYEPMRTNARGRRVSYQFRDKTVAQIKHGIDTLNQAFLDAGCVVESIELAGPIDVWLTNSVEAMIILP